MISVKSIYGVLALRKFIPVLFLNAQFKKKPFLSFYCVSAWMSSPESTAPRQSIVNDLQSSPSLPPHAPLPSSTPSVVQCLWILLNTGLNECQAAPLLCHFHTLLVAMATSYGVGQASIMQAVASFPADEIIHAGSQTQSPVKGLENPKQDSAYLW